MARLMNTSSLPSGSSVTAKARFGVTVPNSDRHEVHHGVCPSYERNKPRSWRAKANAKDLIVVRKSSNALDIRNLI